VHPPGVGAEPTEPNVYDRGVQRQVRRDPGGFTRRLFSPLPRRYDLLAELLSFGQNGRWRRAMVDRVAAAAPARVLDVATGTAGVALLLTERTPASVVGLDLTEAMLRQGVHRVAGRGRRQRIRLLLGRAEQLPFADATFDALTFTYLLRYVADPAATQRELARVVRPGGTVAGLEFLVPAHPLWRACWWLYTRLVLPIGGGLFGRGWFEVGRFLGPSISAYYREHPLDWHLRAWEAAGLESVTMRPMSLGGGLVMWARRGQVDG
jgi:demethylmenaquinone methyltransferase/2-methoxy-6-polyprenyl-1,4-benzoquinol methylase